MEEKCFCHFNGYQVKDAVARKKIGELSAFTTPFMHGAKGDGVSDDTEAIKACIDFAAENGVTVEIPKGTFLVTEPIVIPGAVKICGTGSSSVIKKINDTTVTDKDKEVNTVLLLTGRRIALQDLAILGNNDGGVSGVSFGVGANNFSFNRLFVVNCVNGLYDVNECWMGEISRVHCLNCNTAFNFGNIEATKTSLNLRNCWAENCGDAYVFNNAMYSSLINCGADWCNAVNGNPYGTAYGNEASARGVYHFEHCKEVTVMSCGTEYCYGNGAIYCGDSMLHVYGFVCYGLKSKNIPPYHAYANFAQGVITTSGERNIMTINGIMVDSFENSAISTGYPGKQLSVVGYNYSETAYGSTDETHLIVSGVSNNSGLPVFAGQGNNKKNCFFTDLMNSQMYFQKFVAVGSKKICSTKVLTGNSNRLVIPVNSQIMVNRTSIVKITGINNEYNNMIPYPFSVTVAFGHLDTVKEIAIVEKSDESITATADGCNLVITLPRTYKGIWVDCECFGDYVRWDEAHLAE